VDASCTYLGLCCFSYRTVRGRELPITLVTVSLITAGDLVGQGSRQSFYQQVGQAAQARKNLITSCSKETMFERLCAPYVNTVPPLYNKKNNTSGIGTELLHGGTSASLILTQAAI
jgi:hypothetical protein